MGLTGCSSSLLVKNEHINLSEPGKSLFCENKGVPVANLEAHIVTKKVQFFDKDGKLCKETETAEFKMLPSGKKYCLNINPSWFASNEMTIEINDDGALKKVVMNSDPQLDETIASTANLAKEIGGIMSPALLSSSLDANADVKTCGQKSKVFNLGLTTYQEWKNMRKSK
jgi:hypothetical protein